MTLGTQGVYGRNVEASKAVELLKKSTSSLEILRLREFVNSLSLQPNAHNGHQNRPLGMRSHAGPFDLLVEFGSSPNRNASL